ncbi:hypothetical protein [Streptomyces formicae]|uniref:hypothetical protein n=1 Tax=Streptomyces formicae TaxID=1616117 RepID=UPI0018FE636F|nr:hypothetical protein [Streptomyces formicae]
MPPEPAGPPADSGPWPGGARLHGELRAAKELVYGPCGFTSSQPVAEAESAVYAAPTFTLDGLAVRFHQHGVIDVARARALYRSRPAR